MIVKQNVNIFLPLDMYRSIKALGHQLDMPYVKLIREGISLVLEKYQGRTIKKGIKEL
jgi:hypothetical protein